MSESEKNKSFFFDRTPLFRKFIFSKPWPLLATVGSRRARLATSKTAIMDKLDFQKLFFHLPKLVGKAILVDAGSCGTIESFTDVRWGHVVFDEGHKVPKRRLSVAATVEGYFAAMTNSKESGTPEEIKRLFVTLLGRMQAHKQAVAQVRKSVVLTKRKRGHLDAHVAQEKELQAEHGLQLPECTNKHTMASLEAQFRTLEARKEGQEETLESLELAAPFVFDSWDELLEFSKDQGVGFSRDSLGGGPRAWALSPRVSSLRSMQCPSRC